MFTASIPIPLALSLAVAAAVGYAVATVGMKASSDGAIWIGIVLGAVGFVMAFAAEVVLMRRIDLSVLYISIIAVETILVLTYAAWIGEGLGPRQAIGAALVMAGFLTVSA